MTINPEDFLQLLMGCVMGILVFWIKRLVQRFDQVEDQLTANTGRLVRIETKLEILDEERLRNHNGQAQR